MSKLQTDSADRSALQKESDWYNDFLKMTKREDGKAFKAKHVKDKVEPSSEDELAASQELLKQRKQTVATMEANAKKRFGDALPKALTENFASIKKLLEVPGKIENSDNLLEEIETALNKLASEKAQWLNKLEHFEARFATLEAHTQKAEPSV